MSFSDPVALAARQTVLDAGRVRIAGLAERKREKMLVSSLAFLRGAAPLFYEILAAWPELGAGPEATGWLAGDLHVENFGAYRPSALTFTQSDDEDAQRAVFDMNDFDDATIGPCRLDVLRLSTSMLLGTRELGLDGKTRVALAADLITAHATTLNGAEEDYAAPPCVRSLLDRVRGRTRKALLDARTQSAANGRRFVRGPRYQDLSMEISREVSGAFEGYVASLPSDERPPVEAFQIVDSAFRVAGTGSLGSLRIAVLTRGKGGADGCFIFDLKEQGAPSSAVLFAPPSLGPVARVRAAAQALVRHPPRMLGETLLGSMPCLGRRLAPQEDRLDWTKVEKSELPALARHLGWLTGRAHRRALAAPLPAFWTKADERTLLEGAIRMTGLHEAIYLAYAA